MEDVPAGLTTEVSLTIIDDGAVTIDRIGLPARSTGEIDVRITVAAICGSDVHTVLGHRDTPPRTALGHEGVGLVMDTDHAAVDLRGTRLVPGDRVVFSMLSSCGTCDRCLTGLTMKCRSLLKYGHESVATPPHATGTLADRIRLLPGVPVIRVPDVLSDVQVVSAGCAVATAAAVVEAAGDLPAGGNVLIFGAGAVGAYAAAMFASLGNAVRVRDPVAGRLALVEEFGARPDDSSAVRFPVVVEASGNPAAVADAILAADIGGRVVIAGSVSPGGTTVALDPAHLVRNRLTMAGVHNYSADNFAWGVDWLYRHGRHLGLERLASRPFALSAVDEAFRAMCSGEHPRVLVQPGVAPGPVGTSADRQAVAGVRPTR